jgi:putative transposase
MRRHKVSQRRACKIVEQNRSTQRYEPVDRPMEIELVKAMNAQAAAHPRWGYRMVCQKLKDEGWEVNKKRIQRLWRLEGHRVPPQRAKASGQKAGGTAENAVWNRPATTAGHIWSYDIVSARTSQGAPIRILNIVDEFTRVAVGSYVSGSIGAREVIAALTQTVEKHGKPSAIRSDNGREFIAATVVEWLAQNGIKTAFIEKGSPQQNAYVERFNGTMRNELLNGEEFDSLLEAKVMVGSWIEEYNTSRPHRGLGMLAPLAYAKMQEEGGQ